MSNGSDRRKNGYTQTIQAGLSAVRGFRSGLCFGTGRREKNLARLKNELAKAEAVVIGAGAGLSTSAGFTYSGERFDRYFFDFRDRFGITDMYAGGFYPFPDEQTRWAWWARLIYYNRYTDAPRPVYTDLLKLVRDRDYFVITTNVDHQFQRVGFDKRRLFYTQGDYGLFQSADGRIRETYDNREWVMRAMAAQGFRPDGNGILQPPEDRQPSMRLPETLLPKTPDGRSDSMNLRADDTFVEDAGWQLAASRYAAFLEERAGRRILFLEIGVGANTPAIIKYPFWAMTAENPNAVYACLNFNEAFCPKRIASRSVCIDGDSGDALKALLS